MGALSVSSRGSALPRRYACLFLRLLLLVAGMVVALNQSGIAQTLDSSAIQSTDSDKVTLQHRNGGEAVLVASGATRRVVLDRLFAGRDVTLIWRSTAVADEEVHGRFVGPVDSIARRLLAQSNYFIAYDRDTRHARAMRIIVLASSKGSSPQPSAQLAALPTSQPTAPSVPPTSQQVQQAMQIRQEFNAREAERKRLIEKAQQAAAARYRR
jgi:hypothetical protein